MVLVELIDGFVVLQENAVESARMVVAYQMWLVGFTNVCSAPIWARNFCGLCDSFYLGSFLECLGCVHTMVGKILMKIFAKPLWYFFLLQARC